MRRSMAQPALSKNKKELRQEVDRLLSASRFQEALSTLKRLWLHDAGVSQASWCLNRFTQMRPHLSGILTKHVYILRSDTVEPLVPILRAEAILYDLDLDVQIGAFNAFSQEVLGGAGSLYEPAPDLVILYAEGRSLRPDLYEREISKGPHTEAAAGSLCKERTDSVIDEVSQHFNVMFQEFRSRTSAPLIVHNLWEPNKLVESGVVHGINNRIAEAASSAAGVYVLDYNGLIRRNEIGATGAWWDESKKERFGLPLAAESLRAVALEWLRFIVPLCGRIRKVLVTDLDNTLWGGTIGEDGLSGISAAHPFIELQKAMIELSSKGILLAIASKNNFEDVQEAFNNHAAMELALDQFASVRINWSPKSNNLQEIAKELNLPLDALAFVDNDPVEREEVRTVLPDVFVVELPDDPGGYAAAVLESPVFSRLLTTEEDRHRSRYYAEERQRRGLQESASSLADFLHSLKIETEVAMLNDTTVERAAQLTQRTNQFNLTTRRYTEEEIRGLLLVPEEVGVYVIRSSDRFGDNGITGFAIVSHAPAATDDTAATGSARAQRYEDLSPTARIDLFLISCRVIGRGVETALLSAIIDDCKAQGMAALSGWFHPTAKNMPARDFYERHGFILSAQLDDGSTNWQLQLQSSTVQSPSWINAKRA